MKKLICVLMAVLMLLSLAACSTDGSVDSPASGNGGNRQPENVGSGEAVDSGREYSEWDTFPGNENNIIGYSELGLERSELVIPKDCAKVRGLGGNGNLKKVVFAGSDTQVGFSAFEGCESLETVELPANLTAIEESAFRDCVSLRSISIPDSVTEIDMFAFCGCAALEDAALPKSLTTLGSRAFSECKALKEVELPDMLTSLGRACFSEDESLESVKFGSGLSVIPEDAFYQCSGLTSVELPEGITTLEEGAFALCFLDEIYLPQSITEAHQTCLVDGNPTVVHVYQGSYMDSRVKQLDGSELMTVEYR